MVNQALKIQQLKTSSSSARNGAMKAKAKSLIGLQIMPKA